MFTTICFRDDLSDFEGFLMPSRQPYPEESGSNTNSAKAPCLDSWGAEENDYVNSAYREKRKIIFQEV